MSSVATPAIPSATTIRRPVQHRSFLEDLTIQHGPTDLLGRFFLAADAACRERGVLLSFATFDELLAANEANRDSWKPLFPAFHPAYHKHTDDNSFAFIGRNENGEVVLTQAAVVLRVYDKPLHDMAVDLRVNYSDPARMARPDERCIPTAPSMKTMKGTILLGGATWFHPSMRKTGLAEITPRISRAYGYTRYQTDYTTSFMVAGPLKGGLAKKANFPHIEWGVEFENSPLGNFSSAFCWMEPDFLLNDLREWLDRNSAAQESEERAVERA